MDVEAQDDGILAKIIVRDGYIEGLQAWLTVEVARRRIEAGPSW
jgi:hypothetical protein